MESIASCVSHGTVADSRADSQNEGIPQNIGRVGSTSLDEANAKVIPLVVGMVCDSKNLYEGPPKCGCCTNWVEEYPEDVTPKLEETEAVQRFAILIRNKKSHQDRGKAMQVSSIVVQSPLLKAVLENVFEGYEGITAGLKHVTFVRPFEPFFYRWDRFKEVVENEHDETTRSHLQLLYTVMSVELEETVSTYHDLLNHNVVTFDYLWTLFKPGDVLLCKMGGKDMMVKLQSSEYSGSAACRGFYLDSKYVDWSGFGFGYASHTISIQPFQGTKPITQLEAYPATFNPHFEDIKHQLVSRGKRFETLQGYHYKAYDGLAEIVMSANFGNHFFGPRNRMVDGRIIIHAEMYNRFNPTAQRLDPLGITSFAPRIPTVVDGGHEEDVEDFVEDFSPIHHPNIGPTSHPSVHPPGRSYGMPSRSREYTHHRHPPSLPPAQSQDLQFQYSPADSESLTEDHHLVCSPLVKGYSLKLKKWAKFNVDDVKEIVWNDRAFDSLVLPQGYKDLILSFTKSQSMNSEVFDDVIEGKGQGIIMLLAGEPGVGKTLTAESVAEHMRVPLYSMSAAELGLNSASVEQALGDVLEITQKWKAVLLLDESDVFLEQRTTDGLERNKLVSIFLRMLEYYRGVLFLTTNRVSVLDKALDSRVHVKITYPELDLAARKKVWHNFISMLPSSFVALTEEDLEFLAEKKLNGRQIKNIIKTAQLLASEQEKPLDLEHICTVLQITQIGEVSEG